jgi:23S rRNA (adenine2503-C2)-methyltransferase
MQNEKKVSDLKSMTLTEIEDLLRSMGEPSYRAKQVFKWLYRGIEDFSEMSDLPAALREKLAAECKITTLMIANKQTSSDGTIKYLFALEDGNHVESVLMEYNHGVSLCISTQVGCRMGCGFCASTLGGLIRNLAPSEMLDQILFAEKDSEKQVSNVVLMGIGEPLDNFDNTIRFLDLVHHKDGLFIGHRHISVSTCGLCPAIDKLAEMRLQITLSVSLHSPFDEVRKHIMPGASRYSIAELIRCCDRYFEVTKRRISFEYTMMAGLNDRDEDAREIIKLFRGKPCHINLITLNHVAERDIQPSSKGRVIKFADLLEAAGLQVTRRRSLGSDISAACGQLRREASPLQQ